ncbi:hypothetical protein BBJ29_007839 [Phytophthora kernoviae]|uniref:Uncharacterized protein n=1 Tax=Phytophthora kernoviae TaxID=325452 RepID=A0A3R7N3V9_9STRA|nr:hypothetical protein BBJ29_007839 [Phytophthora kernoviae]
MIESLVFAEQVPTFVYQNVSFQATVKLVDEHKAKVTGVQKTLQVSLRFHDTYDLVEDQDAVLRLSSDVYIDGSTGLALLSMSLHTLTATCDGRNFCLEVRTADAADVESVFSAPVNVVKEKLHVVAQPPDVWFKDEGGREKCMTVTLELAPAPGCYLEDRVVPLDVKLLYESGNPVLNQSILRLFPDMRPNMSHGNVTISFRIDDVSKNHQGQSFMLEVGPEQQDGSSMFQDIAPTRTSVIAIRSKRNKRKLHAQAAAAAATGIYGMRASPRSVAGTPRTPYMNMASGRQNSPPSMGGPPMMIEPHPQRARRSVGTGGMNYAGPALSHSPRCVFSPNSGNDGMNYGSHMEGTPMNQQQQMQQMQHQRGYATYQEMAEQSAGMSMGMNSAQTSTSANSYGSGTMGNPSPMDVQQNTINISSAPTKQEGASPKTLAELATSSAQRPALTISPYMNKVTTEGGTTGNSDQEQASSGNLFESNAFHTQMEALGGSSDKMAFLNKSAPEEDNPALDPQQNYQQGETSSTFSGVIGTSLFNEMTSMGINLDQYDKGETQLLGDFGGLEGGSTVSPTEEDQVFYILARMYTDGQNQKLGLPAFDQFQRMLGFYSESQNDVQTQVVFHPLRDVGLSDKEREEITSQFVDELGRDSQTVHSLPKYQHNLIMLREDALMFYWSQSLV